MTRLMIVESPAKSKKIQGFLGKGWVVRASFGHIRDLPVKQMGVSLDDFRPSYVLNTRSRKHVQELKSLAAEAAEVYLATDPDREGEAIGWHLKEVLGLSDYKRVTFKEVSATALREAVTNARPLDFNLVKAQEGRRVLDRLVGYSVTPAISDIHGGWITAGRVQSVAVRIVVEREIEIRDFVPIDYLAVDLKFDGEPVWVASWVSEFYLEEDQKYMQDHALAEQVAAIRAVRVAKVVRKNKSMRPPAPFITSSLQQVASTTLKFSPKRTMELAQRLFDEGLITYHRTDNPNLSEDGFIAVLDYFNARGKADLCVDRQNHWKVGAGAQEGHEAIRPTDMEMDIDKAIEILDADLAGLYSLIWRRTAASQLKDAEFDVTTVILESSEVAVMGMTPVFKAQGRVMRYPGWKALDQGNVLEGEDAKDLSRDQYLPDLEEGAEIHANDGIIIEKRTKPPGRYTEASLVRKLEKEGIGRPSTFSSILDNITRRDYIKIIKRKLHATDLGFTIYGLLKNRFSFMEIDYTRRIEESLDDLAAGRRQYREVMSEVYGQLSEELEQFKKSENQGRETFRCPKCGAALRLILDKFWGCSSYPDCDYSADNKDGKPVERVLDKTYPCECGKGYYQLRTGPKGKFYGCSSYPSCKNTKPEEGGKPVLRVHGNRSEVANGDCPLCHSGSLVKRTVRRGNNKGRQFYGCTRSHCNFFRWADE